MTDDPFDDFDPDDHEWHPININVSDAWRDIMETQAFLRDDPFEWGVVSTSRYDNHHLEVYVEGEVEDYDTHEGAMVPTNLLRFMAGRGWYVTRLGMGQAPANDQWMPVIGFSRGPEVFDALVRNDIPVEPDGYNWPSLYDAITEGSDA